MDIEQAKLEIDVCIAKLNNILTNINKAPNRNYTRRFLLKLKEKSKDLYKKVNNILVTHETKLTSAELTFYIKGLRQKYEIISLHIEQKLVYAKDPPISLKSTALAVLYYIKLKHKLTCKQNKMASIAEIIKIVSSLVPQYDGSGDKLPSILSALAALNTLITDANRAVAIQVVLSRLEGKARSAVGDNPQTVDAIIESLKRKCKITIAPETVVAKLNATKQTGDIVKFTEQIEKLTMELERAYISEEIPVDTALRMAVKAGVKALAGGVKNSETRLLLKAGQFNTLSAAVEKITENESAGSNSSTSQIMYARRGGYTPGRGNYQSRGRGNNRRGHNSRGNYQNYNREHSYHHRGNGRSRGRGMNHNTYYVQNQNPPQNINHQMPPQQGQPQQQFVQQTQNLPNNGNIHPLGVPLRQHTQ